MRPESSDPVEHLLGPRLEVEPAVLMGLVTRHRRDALHEIENALGLAALLSQHRLDDPGRLRLAEPALAQEPGPLLVAARNDTLPRGLECR